MFFEPVGRQIVAEQIQKTSSDLREENVLTFEAGKRPPFGGRKTYSVSRPHLGTVTLRLVSFSL